MAGLPVLTVVVSVMVEYPPDMENVWVASVVPA